MDFKENFRSEIQVEPDHYDFSTYMELNRFMSLWYRINEIVDLDPDSLLEIGVGGGMLSSLFRFLGINTRTLDIDIRLKPDCVASTVNLPFDSGSFSVVTAFQVLEHLPYDHFQDSLSEMKRVAKNHVVFSIPDSRRFWRLSLKLPFLKISERIITVPQIFKTEHEFDGEHYWELGAKNYQLNRLKRDIREIGLTVLKHFRPKKAPGQHIFVLK